MSWIDAAIPGFFGLLLVVRPQFVFLGSKVEPDEAKLRLMRRLGWGLLVIAGIMLFVG